jgi:FkbM family methyltransferase
VECDKRLVPLFARSFPEARVIARLESHAHYPRQLPAPDLKVAIGSLPRYFRPSLDSFPRTPGYLVPDQAAVHRWKDRYEALGRGLKVGISWKGGKELFVRRSRSTELSLWKEVLALKGAHFINLQYGDCAAELQSVHEHQGVTIHRWPGSDPLADLDDFAAQIASLDLVLSVDNATVHMAGALGIPTWILLPRGSDWRWMQECDDTPWYGSTSLFRQQQEPGNWSGVFTAVAAKLKALTVLPEPSAPERNVPYRDRQRSHTPHHRRALVAASPGGSSRCAVITPVGPGHQDIYTNCLQTIKHAYANHPGRFSEVIPLSVDDREGRLGRSKARNQAVRKAREQGFDWIFFLDADDEMAPRAFESVAPYLDRYDAVWGSLWPIEPGETVPRQRPGQLPFLFTRDQVLSCDPFVTLQMGHFVRTAMAAATPFDETLDAGEDFDYYLRVWDRSACIKVPLPFFYNRRGRHAGGPRSATGAEWRKKVAAIVGSYRRGMPTTFLYRGTEVTFLIDTVTDLLQQHYLRERFFEIDELEYIARSVRPHAVILEVGANIGNHVVFYEKFMRASKIIVIEPNPRALQLLTRNLELNRCSRADLTKAGIGAGSVRGRFSFTEGDPANLGAARLVADDAGPIEVAPLDELIREKVDFIKIDAEGMEMDVLNGARQLIAAGRPDIFIEVMNEHLPAVHAWMEEAGYRVRQIFANVQAVNYYLVPD